MAAVRPTASAMGGVPASKRAGGGGRPEAVELDVEDHAAAAEERRHGVEQLGPAPQHADAGRAHHLVGREGDEVDVELAHVDRRVRDELRAVGHHHGAGGMGRRRRCAAPG